MTEKRLDYKVEEEEEEEEQGEQARQQAEVILYKAIYETPKHKLPEMTNIPLDKIKPLTWMLTYAKEVLALCDEIVNAQKELTKYRIRLSTKYGFGWKGMKNPEWVESWPKLKKKIVLLMTEWVYSYCQFRRSVGGDHLKNAVLLAQDQMATQQEEKEESPWDYGKQQ